MEDSRYAVSVELEKIINNWIDHGENSQRLSILPASTGSGKSYAVAKIMGKRALEEKPSVFVYIVHTKENLKVQYDTFVKLNPEAKNRALLLKEDAEMVMEFFARNQSVKRLEDWSEYQRLKHLADAAEEVRKNQNDSSPLDHMSVYRDTINQGKKQLQERLRREYNSLENSYQKNVFKEEISQLFPTANLQKYKAVFLTTQKFMFPLWTLTGSTYLFEAYEPKTAKEEDKTPARLFVDEFDAQKDTILTIFTKAAANNVIDKISFFMNARHILMSSIFLKKYGIDEQQIERVKRRFDDIYREYIDGFSFVYRGHSEELRRYLLRSELSSTFESSEKPLTIRRDDAEELNIVETKENAKDYRFSHMVEAIDKAIWMLSGVGRVVVSKRKQEIFEKKTEGTDEFVPINWIEVRDSILRQFIGEFNHQPGEKSHTFFENLIMGRLDEGLYNILPSMREEFYDRGLSLIQMENVEENTKRSGFNFYAMNQTPENFLVKVANTMHIIGISATASIESAVRNFDLQYMRTKVIVDHPSPEEISRLNTLYIEGKQQGNRAFHVDFVTGDGIGVSEITKRWFRPEYKEEIRKMHDAVNDPYRWEQYVRLMRIYWEYLTQEEIKSFLVLLNLYPKKDGPLNSGILADLFRMMLNANRNNPTIKKGIREYLKKHDPRRIPEGDLFFIANSTTKSKQDFQREIQEEKLGKGRGAFVLSTYQAMGAGRNIQYMVEGKGEKDYDAIYCDLPTNLLVRGYPSEEEKIESLLRLLYQIHALRASQNISRGDFNQFLKHAMTVNTSGWMKISYKNGEDYYNTVMSILIQAVGRLHRVNKPNDPMFIYLDEHFKNAIQNFDTTGHALLPSIMEVIKVAKEEAPEKEGDTAKQQFAQRTADQSAHMNRKIHQMLRVFHSKKEVEKYEAMREFILKNPTTENLSHPYNGLYTPPLPTESKKHYWYKEIDDFGSVEVSLVKRNHPFVEVSPEGARLDILARIPVINMFMEQKGVPLTFDHPHFMTPVVFNNLYKGILGETVGKWMVETYCGATLNHIDPESGHYEFFDYVTEKGIGMDFKYYSEHYAKAVAEIKTLLHGKDGKGGAISKREAMGLDRAVIINIFGSKGQIDSREIVEEGGVSIVPFVINVSNENHPYIDSKMIAKIARLLA